MSKLQIFLVVALIIASAFAQWDDSEDHSLHCHHPDDDTIHLHVGESQTLKGTCILLICVHHVTDLLAEARCPKVHGPVIPGVIGKPFPDCCDKPK